MDFSYDESIHTKFCDALVSTGVEPYQDLLLIISGLANLLNKTMFKLDKLERKVEELEANIDQPISMIVSVCSGEDFLKIFVNQMRKRKNA